MCRELPFGLRPLTHAPGHLLSLTAGSFPACKFIPTFLEATVVERILTHLSLQAQAPPRAPAPGPQLKPA
jgi:hypothetical protein